MLKRVIIIVVAFSALSFVVINGRFLVANLRFSFSHQYQIVNPDIVNNSGGSNKRLIDPGLFASSQAAAILFIPKINVEVPIVFNVPNNNTAIYQSLENGVVNSSATVKPGENGLSLILGHSSALPWYPGKYGSAFALLGKLRPTDMIYVQYADGTLLNYAVSRSLVFNPLGKDNLNQLSSSGQKLILVSCWPIGVSYQRIAIEALPVTSH